MRSPVTPELRTRRLVLTPLEVTDPPDMVGVLADRELYVFTGDGPPKLDELRDRYRVQVAGPSTGDEVWHNWILRLAESGTAVGFVQATIVDRVAELAWLVGVDWQGEGIAREAVASMRSWLEVCGVERLIAHIHPEHAVSGRVAAAIGLRPTEEVDVDGEVVWLACTS